MAGGLPIITFSHLRWNFVYQRPQHLLSRLSAHHKIYFIEEPQYGNCTEPFFHIEHHDAVTVCRPFSPINEYGFTDRQIEAVRPLVHDLVKREGLSDYLVWMYTPMALPLAQDLTPRVVVYDIMDELSAFTGAPPELLDRQADLLKLAHVVFTGGPSLYRAKEGQHHNLHCFPSSVDAQHFAQANQGVTEPEEQVGLPHPRLGYFGVIDERMDLNLIDQLARTHPEWQIVLVGPVVKIDPASLPQHPNLHYFGHKAYTDLPHFIAGWDVGLLPFALNEATRFISPTKTLEYMAAERPIVSTPITDVAEPYGEIVYLGTTAEEFIAACEQALAADQTERERRFAMMRAVLRDTSWNSTAQAMEDQINQALAESLSTTKRGVHPSTATHVDAQVSALDG